jgi:hypothetical protein
MHNLPTSRWSDLSWDSAISFALKDFAIIAAPLFKVTRKDSRNKNGPLPPDKSKDCRNFLNVLFKNST